MSSALKAHIVLPVTLYRMTLGGKVKVRKQPKVGGDPKASFDIRIDDSDNVEPQYQDLENYKGTNLFSFIRRSR